MGLLLIFHVFNYVVAVAISSVSPMDPTVSSHPIYFSTELEKAIRDGDAGRVQALLADEAVDPTVDDNRAIGLAAFSGHTECARLLLADERVNPAAGNDSAIRVAADRGHAECVKLLLADERVNPAAGNNWAIRWAARNGHAGCVEILLADSRVDPTADNDYAISFAAQHGNTECVKLLLAGPRVNPATDNFLIRVAAQNGHTGCVRLLLADGRVNPTTKDNYAIRAAARNGHTNCVEALLSDPRVDPAADANYAIRWAAHYDRKECVKLLLADPRVDPGAASGIRCPSEICSLIEHIRTCKDGDMDAFKKMDLTALSNTVLDIFISRNRSFPQVLRHFLEVQLACLTVPETVSDDPGFETLVNAVISRGPWRTSDLPEVIRTFIRLKNSGGFPREWATIIAIHSCNPVA